MLRGRSRDLEQLRELVRRRFTDGDLQMAMDPTATTELLARKLAGEAIEDNAEVVEKGIRAWSAHLKVVHMCGDHPSDHPRGARLLTPCAASPCRRRAA